MVVKRIQAFDLRDVFKTERTLLSLSGFYPQRHQINVPFYFTSALINVVVSYLQLFSMFGQMVVDRKDLSKLTDTLLFFMTHFTFLGKLTNFGYYRQNLLAIEDDLCARIFYSFSEKQLGILISKIGSCNTIAKIFRMSCVLCIIFYSVLPLLGDEKNLPLPGWLPYDTDAFYLETIIFQILSVCVSAYNNSSIDILTWKLIAVASGEMEILKENLRDLEYKSNGDKELEVTKETFGICIQQHNAVIDLVHKIEFVFSKGIFMQFLSSVIIICFTGFQLLVVPMASIQFVFLVMYFFCMMCQVAMYCWYGHEVMTTSDELGKFCYMSNWYDSDINIRKSITIFLEKTKKPVVLTAGKFVTLSLATLTGILRSSYSYFAVLQHLYQEDS
ncbi:hypothetical protein Zmor_012920 [Zophobas morio]|uniref:Odorant receptor n=1 Tax=Zophobas morio TaxID=2755281 RepID=A0AA38IGU3_9CUCU|nr:hypothetical protein Zmor_012920 [Zophobas morio]